MIPTTVLVDLSDNCRRRPDPNALSLIFSRNPQPPTLPSFHHPSGHLMVFGRTTPHHTTPHHNHTTSSAEDRPLMQSINTFQSSFSSVCLLSYSLLPIRCPVAPTPQG